MHSVLLQVNNPFANAARDTPGWFLLLLAVVVIGGFLAYMFLPRNP